MSPQTLKKAARLRPEGVLRLARYLRLQVDGMSPKHVAKLVAWRLHPNRDR